MVEDKIRMCDVLSDIEVAQDLLELKPDEEEEPLERQPHPADEKYATLQADLNVIQPSEEEYKIVRKFAEVLLKSWQLHLQHLCSCPKLPFTLSCNDFAPIHMPHAWYVPAIKSGPQRSVGQTLALTSCVKAKCIVHGLLFCHTNSLWVHSAREYVCQF